MGNNNDYTTGNLLDFAHFKENYKLIAIDLSKQTKLKDPQQINFIGKIEGQNNRAKMFFIFEKSEEITLNFSQNSVIMIQVMETQNIVNLLNSSDNEYSNFETKKWHVTGSETTGAYSENEPIKFFTRSIESSHSDYSHAYILVTGNITSGGNNTKAAFKN